MSDASQPQETEGLKVTVRDPNKVDIKDFKFKTAKQLDKQLKRAERILSFDDPENLEVPIHVHLRALTAKEESILYQATFSEKDVKALADVFLEKTENHEKLETSDITGIVTEKLTDTDTDEKKMDRYYRRLQMGIVRPSGVTIEWLKRRNPNMLDIMSDVLDELQIENEIWLLDSLTAELPTQD